MSALEIVIGQVAGDVAARFEAILVFGHFEFNLDGSETRFHESVVVAVSGAAHALAHGSAAQQGSIGTAGILSATIAVMN